MISSDYWLLHQTANNNSNTTRRRRHCLSVICAFAKYCKRQTTNGDENETRPPRGFYYEDK
tara:strand:+ start:129 stop:311 length:183 start_codon:yes stop_codon:yes gene_type:complete